MSGLRVAFAAIFMLIGVGLAACEDDGPVEEAGEKVDESVEEAGDAIEDAAD